MELLRMAAVLMPLIAAVLWGASAMVEYSKGDIPAAQYGVLWVIAMVLVHSITP